MVANTFVPVLLGATLLCMLAEAVLSRRHERYLRSHGALEPKGDVYRVMAWTYPLVFVLMAFEGRLGPREDLRPVGLSIFVLAKAVKYWAVSTLGQRWSFRVLVPSDQLPIRSGPYRWLRHPNYLALIGEILGFGLAVGSLLLTTLSLAGFGLLLRRRIGVEEAALRAAASRMGGIY